MNKVVLFIVFIGCSFGLQAQNNAIWKSVTRDPASVSARTDSKENPDVKLYFELDAVALETILEKTHTKTEKNSAVEVVIPNMKGVLERYLVRESSNFDAQLQAKYPEIRAYVGTGITDAKASLHFSLSPKGIQTMVLRADNATEFIELNENTTKQYILFDSKNRKTGTLPFTCKTEDKVISKNLFNKTVGTKANNKVFKTLKLALSCTGEYGVYHGGTVALALAAMNATMTRVNGIFNKDLAVKLVLVANNELVIYTDPATDPYTTVVKNAPAAWNDELETALNGAIGVGNYDIGHLFGATGGGGNADCIGCVCDTGKGRGYTSPSNGVPKGDTFDVDFVAHEMGHQLGANHTFSFDGTERSGVNVEPGSGSTIMAYAGITDYNVQNNSDDYFAYASILQIQNNLTNKACPVSVAINNGTTTVSAGADYTIPKGTAFKLTGTGGGTNVNSLSYCWEENDSALTADSGGANSITYSTKTDGSLFRSFKPNSSPVRYFPALSRVVAGQLSSTWESVPTVAKTLKFVLTVRDNAALGLGQTASDNAVVTVSGTVGPLTITSQNVANTTWAPSSSQTITWAVNNTKNLVGSANVNIKLSTDGGLTFPTVLVSNTPNDGAETIVVPTTTATNCRILIEPTANIYYAINSSPFSIGYAAVSSCDTYTFQAPFAIPESATYTTRTIVVPATTATIVDVNFNVDFTHSYMGDVQMEIVNPLGTTVKLFDRDCSSTNSSLSLKYDDLGGLISCNDAITQTIAPANPLSVFNGLNPSGTWTFRIRDAFVGDTGTLDAASVSICTKTYTLGDADFEINDFVLYPNPNKGNFTIQFNSTSNSGVKVQVTDLLGRTIYDNTFAGKSNFKEQIQLKNATTGIYVLTVLDGHRKVVKKIVVE
ncbi:zinc-dependent metalloprotease [Flavobacterium restrictum]|uniref:T9SS type A sorting domain-containing protein n=1 Tax=Flavobacterium restrictum TaxID=2594428 RepID=A0A553E390_9FLAO|nr:zinc-dependent metalloprotease family protein [Flavobacterium restrictum]TRX39511.1 T9SS type A sorting domain-containing protein [Flavobacterium restrictum]